MFLIFVFIFFTLSIIIKSYKHIDNQEVLLPDIIKAAIPAIIGIICLVTRMTYFALPEEGMISLEYLSYRRYLIWIFVALMGYIVRTLIFGSVFLYRRKNQS